MFAVYKFFSVVNKAGFLWYCDVLYATTRVADKKKTAHIKPYRSEVSSIFLTNLQKKKCESFCRESSPVEYFWNFSSQTSISKCFHDFIFSSECPIGDQLCFLNLHFYFWPHIWKKPANLHSDEETWRIVTRFFKLNENLY